MCVAFNYELYNSHCVTLMLAPLYPQHRSLIFGVYGGLAVLVTMGWTFMALVLSHCIILYSVALAKKKSMCFAVGLTTLASIKLDPYNSWQVSRWLQVQGFSMLLHYKGIKTQNAQLLD